MTASQASEIEKLESLSIISSGLHFLGLNLCRECSQAGAFCIKQKSSTRARYLEVVSHPSIAVSSTKGSGKIPPQLIAFQLEAKLAGGHL